MLKKHMAACLVATAFAAAPVMAQTTPPPPSAGTDRPAASGTGTTTSGSNAMQPGSAAAPAPATPAPAAPMAQSGAAAPAAPAPAAPAPVAQSGSPSGAQGQFMTRLEPNQMMASSLIGTTVVSANNESIGDVNDVLMDRNGQAVAVVVGVGGFLGIGEKDVAVPFQSLDFNAQPQQTSSTAAPAGGNNAGSSAGMAPSTTGSTAGTPTNTSTATTGNTGTTGNNTASSTGDPNGGVPDRVVLKMTKAELQSAPAFQGGTRAGSDSSNNTTGAGAGSSSGSGAGTAPRQ